MELDWEVSFEKQFCLPRQPLARSSVPPTCQCGWGRLPRNRVSPLTPATTRRRLSADEATVWIRGHCSCVTVNACIKKEEVRLAALRFLFL